LTSIIYSLTLGCIIFLLVTASLEIQSISSLDEVANVDILLRSEHISAADIDPVLAKYD